ncbi:MAG: alkaline phosphatase family protein [Pseudomonadota bacterium]
MIRRPFRIGTVVLCAAVTGCMQTLPSSQSATPASALQSDQPERPALVLAIVVDQMRYDYLARFEHEFTGGLKRLLDEGAVFTNANYEAAPTVTAVGHSTFLTGATPSVSGIAGNAYYGRIEGRMIQSITDDNVTPLGDGGGASPHRLAVSTVGDELKISGKGGKVYGVSLKDRSAILPAGRAADGAFWFGDTGTIVSSSWYFPALPDWVQTYNASKPAERYLGAEWSGRQLPTEASASFFTRLDATPFADELVLEFALQVMQEENLGTDQQTDLLAVSFSATDYLGHATGTETPQMREMILSVDKRIGELLAAAEEQAGRGKVLVVLTADHGVSLAPEDNAARQLPGGRYEFADERAAVQAALSAAFGEGDYIEGTGEMSIYLHRDPVPGKHISLGDMERVAAATLRQQPHVARVYTRTELESSHSGGDRIDQRVRNGFNRQHSGDIVVVHEPNWINRATGTTHGSPYSYDSHVPVIFWGPEALVRPGRYHRDAAVHDIAPTLATMLQIATPSGAQGRALEEILP